MKILGTELQFLQEGGLLNSNEFQLSQISFINSVVSVEVHEFFLSLRQMEIIKSNLIRVCNQWYAALHFFLWASSFLIPVVIEFILHQHKYCYCSCTAHTHPQVFFFYDLFETVA